MAGGQQVSYLARYKVGQTPYLDPGPGLQTSPLTGASQGGAYLMESQRKQTKHRKYLDGRVPCHLPDVLHSPGLRGGRGCSMEYQG